MKNQHLIDDPNLHRALIKREAANERNPRIQVRTVEDIHQELAQSEYIDALKKLARLTDQNR